MSKILLFQTDLSRKRGRTINPSFLKGETKVVVYVLLVLLSSLIARIILFPVQGCLSDLATFAVWFKAAADHGPSTFYKVVPWCDYPPFNDYLFWIFGSLANGFSLFGTRYIYYVIKLPSTLFDIATAGLIFTFLRRRLTIHASLIATSLYAFNPATIFNEAIWGQFDAIYTFFLILSLILIFESKPKLSAAAFTAAVLTKPQSIALAPLIIFLLAKRCDWKTAVTSILASAAVVLIVAVPVSFSNLGNFLVDIYLKGYRGYPYTSLNAFNVWALNGFWKSDAQVFTFLNFFEIGWMMFSVLAAFSLYYLHRMFRSPRKTPYAFEVAVLFTAFALLFGFFMLPTRIHERYLFPVFSVLAMMLPFAKESRPLFAVLTVTYLANLAYVLPFLNTSSFIPDGDPFVLVITAINLTAFAYALIVMVSKMRVKPSQAGPTSNEPILAKPPRT